MVIGLPYSVTYARQVVKLLEADADDTQSIIIADNKEELEEVTRQESQAVLDFFSGIHQKLHQEKLCIALRQRLGLLRRIKCKVPQEKLIIIVILKNILKQKNRH